MAWQRPRKPCIGCGEPKGPGRGNRYCETCARKPHRPPGQPTPCHACGSTDGKQRNKHYCDECRELRQWRTKKRKQAIQAADRKPCGRCGRPKGPGKAKRFCDACVAQTKALPLCRRCGEQPIRRRFAQLCEACEWAAIERRRERHRASYYRQRDKSPDRLREKNREKARRRQADPVKRASDLERRRLLHRLRAQREGRPVRTLVDPQEPPQFSLPGAPLAAAIFAIARREARGNPFAITSEAHPMNGHLTMVCERAGVSERGVTRWRTGETAVWFSTADEVLTRLGLFWWDVWTEETVRKPLFTVHSYSWKWKHQRGELKHYRMHIRSTPYGDAGPDFEELRRVESLMSGEAVAV